MLGVVQRRLDELALGRWGTIASVAGDDAMKIRLLEMGLVAGTRVKIVKRAPGGDPLQLQVRGYHLSVRVSEAARVLVEEGT